MIQDESFQEKYCTYTENEVESAAWSIQNQIDSLSTAIMLMEELQGRLEDEYGFLQEKLDEFEEINA